MVAREHVRPQLQALDAEGRRRLARFGVRLGVYNVFISDLLGEAALRMKALLLGLGGKPVAEVDPSRTSLPVSGGEDREGLHALGYQVLGTRAVRVDMLERLGVKLRRKARDGRFEPDAGMLSMIGCTREEFVAVAVALGYRRVEGEDGAVMLAAAARDRRRGRSAGKTARGRKPAASEHKVQAGAGTRMEDGTRAASRGRAGGKAGTAGRRQGPRHGDVLPDPESPFAKLITLKQGLQGGQR